MYAKNSKCNKSSAKPALAYAHDKPTTSKQTKNEATPKVNRLVTYHDLRISYGQLLKGKKIKKQCLPVEDLPRMEFHPIRAFNSQLELKVVNSYRNQIARENADNFDDEYAPRRKKSDTSLTTFKSKYALTQFFKMIQCPFKGCDCIYEDASLLSHYLANHAANPLAEIKEITDFSATCIEIDLDKFPMQDNVLITIMVYGGSSEKFLPAQIGMCVPNAFLPDSHQHLLPYLPIMLWGCKIQKFVNVMGHHSPDECSRRRKAQDVFMIWATGPMTMKPIHLILQAYDKDYHYCNRKHLLLTPLQESQQPEKMLNKKNRMLCTHRDLRHFTQGFTKSFNVDILVNDM